LSWDLAAAHFLLNDSKNTWRKTIYTSYVPPSQIRSHAKYLQQVQFARSNALASYKAKDMESIAAVSCHTLNEKNSTVVTNMAIQSARIVLHIQRETALHVDYCASFGLSKEEMEKLPEKMGKCSYAFSASVVLLCSNDC
jgi:uncharacterized membrane protein